MSHQSELIPIVVIVGTTGVGKTKLSLSIANALNGEIIGADSMQVYRGLDVGAAKPTPTELDTIPHHLMGAIPPTSACDVHRYVACADDAISSVHARGKLPIVCGGTFYWLEQLLFETLVTRTSTTTSSAVESADAWPPLSQSFELGSPEDVNSRAFTWANQQRKSFSSPRLLSMHLRTLTDHQLHQCLSRIDPLRAEQVRGQNRRLRRALEWVATTGTMPSHAHTETGGRSGMRLRYRAALLWVWADASVVQARCVERLREMVQLGVVGEVWSLARLWVARARVGLPWMADVNPAYGRVARAAGDSADTAAGSDGCGAAGKKGGDKAVMRDNQREGVGTDPPATLAPPALTTGGPAYAPALGRVAEWPWSHVDTSVGLAQAIGLKELLPWVEHVQLACARADAWLSEALREVGLSGALMPGSSVHCNSATEWEMVEGPAPIPAASAVSVSDGMLASGVETCPSTSAYRTWPCACALVELCGVCRYPSEGPISCAARVAVAQGELVARILAHAPSHALSTSAKGKKRSTESHDAYTAACARFEKSFLDAALAAAPQQFPQAYSTTASAEAVRVRVREACARVPWQWPSLATGVAQLHSNTHRYARAQAKWISQRLLKVAREWAPQHTAVMQNECMVEHGSSALRGHSAAVGAANGNVSISISSAPLRAEDEHAPVPALASAPAQLPPVSKWGLLMVRADSSRVATGATAPVSISAPTRKKQKASLPPLLSPEELVAARDGTVVAHPADAVEALPSDNSSLGAGCVCHHPYALTGDWQQDVVLPMLSAVRAFLGLPHTHTHAHAHMLTETPTHDAIDASGAPASAEAIDMTDSAKADAAVDNGDGNDSDGPPEPRPKRARTLSSETTRAHTAQRPSHASSLLSLPPDVRTVPSCLVPYLLVARPEAAQHVSSSSPASSSASLDIVAAATPVMPAACHTAAPLDVLTDTAGTDVATDRFAAQQALAARMSVHCSVCTRTIAGPHNWEAHVRSKAHRALALRERRRRERGEAETKTRTEAETGGEALIDREASPAATARMYMACTGGALSLAENVRDVTVTSVARASRPSGELAEDDELGMTAAVTVPVDKGDTAPVETAAAAVDAVVEAMESHECGAGAEDAPV